jgi:multiple antibiotic resistance protein
MFREIILLSVSFFLVMNPIGNIPAYISILHGIDSKKQVRIIIRELIIALFVILLFYYLGEGFLNFLHIRETTVQVAGGLILYLIAIKLIFPPSEGKDKDKDLKKITEPFIVPLAVPLVAGPAVLASVIIYGHQISNAFISLSSILISWCASLSILISAPFIAKKLGERGIIAIQRLMGLILILIATETFLTGIKSFWNCR